MLQIENTAVSRKAVKLRVSEKTVSGKSARKVTTTLRPYLMVAPAMVIFGLFILYPIFNMIYLSFFDWNLIGEKKFIGVKNYTHMFADTDFWQVLGNSVYYMVMVVILQMALSLLLAVYLNKNTRIITSGFAEQIDGYLRGALVFVGQKKAGEEYFTHAKK